MENEFFTVNDMLLRDYFAAHAPEPFDYWEPVMSIEAPEMPPTNPYEVLPDLSELMADTAELWLQRVTNKNYDQTDESIKPFIDLWMEYKTQEVKWSIEYSRQYSMQWPYAYADIMLEQRKCTST